MEFRVLGPVEVADGVSVHALGGPKPRTILGILLAHANTRVSTDRLIDELWGESPPDAARKSLQSYVAQLRRIVNADGEVLRSDPPGYVITPDVDSLDSLRFERLVQEARELVTDQPAQAAAVLREALALWRGPAYDLLTDETPSLRHEAARLEGMKLGALESRLEADVLAGSHGDLVPELQKLTTAHPYRERLWELYMLALYRSGRQADALRAYTQLRTSLGTELGLEPSPRLQRLEQSILEHDEATLIPTTTAAPPSVTVERRNPYKGLRAFHEEDATDFFGRDALVRRLLERLARRDLPGLIVLAGPSGAGKSSVMRAGFIPAVRNATAEGGRTWNVATMVPGAQPFRRLAQALGRSDFGSLDSEPDDISLPHADGDPLLLIIDQFEELFTLGAGPATQGRFLDWIATAAARPERDVVVVLTIRADFLDRPLQHRLFGKVLEPGLVLVPPLLDNEVRDAIVEPATRAGIRVEPGVVATMISEVSGRPASLPLLQFALTELFEARTDDTITTEAYRAAGGLPGALARRSEAVFGESSAQEQAAIRQVLLRLVAVTDEGDIVRRRVRRDELDALPIGSDVIDRVLDRLVRHRLLVIDQEPGAGPAVDIAHEAVTREWSRLSGWLEGAREDLHQQRRLGAGASEWVNGDRNADYLLSGTRLALFASWAETTDLALTEDERSYLMASAEHAAATDRAQARRRRAVVGSLALAAVLAAGLAAFALEQRSRAVEQQLLAEQEAARAEDAAQDATSQARVADARRLAASALANLDLTPESSLIDAIEGVQVTRNFDGTVLKQAEEALHQAVLAIRTEFAAEGGGAAHFSPDGSTVVAGGPDDISVLDSQTGELMMTLSGHTDLVFNAVFSPDGQWIASNSRDGTTKIWDTTSGMHVATLDKHDPPLSIAFSSDSATLATSHADGTARVWDTVSWGLLHELNNPGPAGVNFDSTGSRLAVASDVGIRVFDVDSGEITLTIRAPDGDGFLDVDFSPDDRLLVAADPIGIARIYDAATGRETERLFGHSGSVEAVDFGPDGLVATGSTDGQARVWQAATGEELLVLSGQGAGVINVAFDSDGRRLATGGANGTVRVWDISASGSSEWYTLTDHPAVIDADFSPDGTVLGTAGFDGTARLWDARSGEMLLELAGHGGPVRRIDLGDGVAATASFDGSARIWDTTTGEELWSFGIDGIVGGVSISADSSMVALVGGTSPPCEPGPGVVAIHDLSDGSPILERQIHDDFIATDISFGPDGSWFATAACGPLRVFESATGALVWERQAHSGFNPGMLQIDVSPGGEWIATASWDGTAAVWNSDTGDLYRSFDGHSGEVWSVEFTPDGASLATAGTDGTARIWNVEGGFETLALRNLGTTVEDVAVSPDGRMIATTSGLDGIVRVLALDIDDLLNLARDAADRFVDMNRAGLDS